MCENEKKKGLVSMSRISSFSKTQFNEHGLKCIQKTNRNKVVLTMK